MWAELPWQGLLQLVCCLLARGRGQEEPSYPRGVAGAEEDPSDLREEGEEQGAPSYPQGVGEVAQEVLRVPSCLHLCCGQSQSHQTKDRAYSRQHRWSGKDTCGAFPAQAATAGLQTPAEAGSMQEPLPGVTCKAAGKPAFTAALHLAGTQRG